MNVAVVPFRPVGGNRAFFTATEPEFVAVGPAGTGKTYTACMRLHLVALNTPGVRILMARKVLEDLKTGALHTYTNKIRPEEAGVVSFGGNRFYPAEFRYPNGSIIAVVGMDKPGKVMSSEWDIIYVNEATELGQGDWQALKTRLRNGRLPRQLLMGDCNPSGPRHWLNQRCNDGLCRRIVTTHKDNPAYWDPALGDWTALGRQYVQENLATLTGVEYQRLFLGVWAAAEGVVYREFQPEMIHAQDIEHWDRYCGVDIGSRNPTAILSLAVRGDQAHTHVQRELYRTDMTSSDIVTAIKAEADSFNPLAIFIDPSAKGYIADLRRDGYPAIPANNDVLKGIQTVRTALMHGFSIDPSCVHTIEEFGMYAYPENPKTETDKPTKEHDHAMDALRYGVMGAMRPRAPRPGVY